MGPLTTPRLIAAAAALAPADLALVHLWVHRGIDDARLAALTGMPPATVQARRERIVTELSRALDVPAEIVAAALPGVVGDSAPGRPDVSATAGGLASPATVSTTGPAPVEPRSAAVTEPDPLPTPPSPAPPAPDIPPPLEPGAPAAGPDPEAQVEPPPEPGVPPDRRRGRAWAGGLIVVAVAVAALLIALLSGGGTARRPAAGIGAPSPAATTSTPSPPATTPDPPTTPPAPAVPRLGAFAGLPGGLRGAGGAITLVGHGRTLRLRLRVRGLPAPGRGHYEAWLYTSVLQSRPLGRVRDGRRESFRVPAAAARYRYIDISLQPRGVVNHSGESRLRTANPVRDLRAHPRHPAQVPRHRSLQPAGTGGAAATTHPRRRIAARRHVRGHARARRQRPGRRHTHDAARHRTRNRRRAHTARRHRART